MRRNVENIFVRLVNSALSVKHWAAVSVATSGGGGGGGVKRSERVIRVNWTKHHHMWPGRRFWEEGWVTYQRRCHSRVLTSNLLMCLPSTSNSDKPHPEQSESTSCSRQQQAGAASDIIPPRWAFPQQVPSNLWTRPASPAETLSCCCICFLITDFLRLSFISPVRSELLQSAVGLYETSRKTHLDLNAAADLLLLWWSWSNSQC